MASKKRDEILRQIRTLLNAFQRQPEYQEKFLAVLCQYVMTKSWNHTLYNRLAIMPGSYEVPADYSGDDKDTITPQQHYAQTVTAAFHDLAINLLSLKDAEIDGLGRSLQKLRFPRHQAGAAAPTIDGLLRTVMREFYDWTSRVAADEAGASAADETDRLVQGMHPAFYEYLQTVFDGDDDVDDDDDEEREKFDLSVDLGLEGRKVGRYIGTNIAVGLLHLLTLGGSYFVWRGFKSTLKAFPGYDEHDDPGYLPGCEIVGPILNCCDTSCGLATCGCCGTRDYETKPWRARAQLALIFLMFVPAIFIAAHFAPMLAPLILLGLPMLSKGVALGLSIYAIAAPLAGLGAFISKQIPRIRSYFKNKNKLGVLNPTNPEGYRAYKVKPFKDATFERINELYQEREKGQDAIRRLLMEKQAIKSKAGVAAMIRGTDANRDKRRLNRTGDHVYGWPDHAAITTTGQVSPGFEAFSDRFFLVDPSARTGGEGAGEQEGLLAGAAGIAAAPQVRMVLV
jgi:hypothetical protein